jgi:hypothetical protein
MSFFSSRPKKIKRKGAVRQLKFVETVSRSGLDTLKAEEVKTSQPRLDKSLTANQPCASSSPSKHMKLDVFDQEQNAGDLEGCDNLNKRKTLVFVFRTYVKCVF